MASKIPSVTWILPIKNGMPYLPETLATLEAQSYTDWELLVWDNGSTDGTLEELQRWLPSRIPGRVITGRPLSLGLSLAALVKEARSPLCARIDADDLCAPDRLERQVRYIEAHPEVALVGSQLSLIDSEGNHSGEYGPIGEDHTTILHGMMVNNQIAHPAVLFRKAVVESVGNYRDVLYIRDKYIRVEDYDLWLRLMYKYKVHNLPEKLMKYRVHQKSVTQVSMSENILDEALNTLFAEHAPLLYGCTSEEAKMLRERTHPQTMSVFRKIAHHLDQTQGELPTSRFKSHSFLNSCLQLTNAEDFKTRLQIALLAPHHTDINQEVRNAFHQIRARVGLRTRLKTMASP